MSWLRDYLLYTEHQESPEIFHFWTGMTAIAAVVKKNIWLDRRQFGVTYFKNYPGSMQTILVGDSGQVKKSSAVRIFRRFLPNSVNVIRGGKSSTEAFLDELDSKRGGNSQSFLIEDEFAVFLSKATYAEGLINSLLTLFDGEDLPFRTRGGGKILITDPCLTVLGCTTPYDLGNSIPPGVTAEAFKSRLLPVYADKTDRICSLTDIEDEDVNDIQLKRVKELESRLQEGLDQIDQSAGPFRYTKDGRDWFDRWDREWKLSPLGKKEGYPARKPDHILRIAMILVIAKCYGDVDKLLLDERSLKAALLALENIEVNFDNAYLHVGTIQNKNRERVVDCLYRHGGMATQQELVKDVWRYFQDMDAIKKTVHVLQQAGIIKLIDPGDKKQNKPEIWGLVK